MLQMIQVHIGSLLFSARVRFLLATTPTIRSFAMSKTTAPKVSEISLELLHADSPD